MYDISIIGSGPAGLTAAIYAVRFGYNVILFSGPQKGGQLTITNDVENYPGFVDPIGGLELIERMIDQAKRLDVKISDEIIESVDFSDKPFTLMSNEKNVYCSNAVIVATGALAKWLGIKGETEYRGKGVSACAICDAFFFKKKKVVVIGGGNAAVEEALYLSKFADVTLIHRRESLRAERILQKRLFENESIKIIWNSLIEEICGDGKKVTHVQLKNIIDDTNTQLQIDGVFVAIGHAPATGLFENQLALDDDGYIITSTGTTLTSKEGVFAAGDVQDKHYRQAVTAAGFGCMAAIDADKYLKINSL